MNPRDGVLRIDAETALREPDRTLVLVLGLRASRRDLIQSVCQVAPHAVIFGSQLGRLAKHPRGIDKAAEEVVNGARIRIATASRFQLERLVERARRAFEVAAHFQGGSQIVECGGADRHELRHTLVLLSGQRRSAVVEQEVAERRVGGPVAGIDIDGAAVRAFGFGDALQLLVGAREPDIGVHVAGVFADGGVKDRRRLVVTPGDGVEMRQPELHLPQRGVESQCLVAGGFRTGGEGGILAALITDGVALAQAGVREREPRVDGERLAEQTFGLTELRGRGRLTKLRQPRQVEIERRQMLGRRLSDSPRKVTREHHLQRADDRAREIVLYGKKILPAAIVVLRPDLISRTGVDELGRHTQVITLAPHAALQDVAHS